MDANRLLPYQPHLSVPRALQAARIQLETKQQPCAAVCVHSTTTCIHHCLKPLQHILTANRYQSFHSGAKLVWCMGPRRSWKDHRNVQHHKQNCTTAKLWQRSPTAAHKAIIANVRQETHSNILRDHPGYEQCLLRSFKSATSMKYLISCINICSTLDQQLTHCNVSGSGCHMQGCPSFLQIQHGRMYTMLGIAFQYHVVY